jgi:hypothetical protein
MYSAEKNNEDHHFKKNNYKNYFYQKNFAPIKLIFKVNIKMIYYNFNLLTKMILIVELSDVDIKNAQPQMQLGYVKIAAHLDLVAETIQTVHRVLLVAKLFVYHQTATLVQVKNLHSLIYLD